MAGLLPSYLTALAKLFIYVSVFGPDDHMSVV